ncbi:MAG: hypothetical protein ACREJ2_12025 [Planctomycetota bacterium]
MLAPDDYTQPIATHGLQRGAPAAQPEIDSKLQIKGPGPKMISFTLPAFGLVCATAAIGFACIFVLGRMTAIPAHAAGLDSADSAPATHLPAVDINAPLDINPPDDGGTRSDDSKGLPTGIVSNTADAGDLTAANGSASTAAGKSVWGYEVIRYKAADKGDVLAGKMRDRLASEGFSTVCVVPHGDALEVIVGADSSYRSLEKSWKDKLKEKGYRADPVSYVRPAETK